MVIIQKVLYKSYKFPKSVTDPLDILKGFYLFLKQNLCKYRT